VSGIDTLLPFLLWRKLKVRVPSQSCCLRKRLDTLLSKLDSLVQNLAVSMDVAWRITRNLNLEHLHEMKEGFGVLGSAIRDEKGRNAAAEKKHHIYILTL
jgi:hypothetical protein